MNYEQLRTLLSAYIDWNVSRSKAKHGWTDWRQKNAVESVTTEMLLEDLAAAITDSRPHLYLEVLVERWQRMMAEEYERGEQIANSLPEEVVS